MSDKRTNQTQQLIYEALLTYMQNGASFQGLTVTDIAEAAHISRQTFYNHYANLESIILIPVQGYVDNFFEQFAKAPDFNGERLVTTLYQGWLGHMNLFRLLIWAKLDNEFMTILRDFNIRIMQLSHTSKINAPLISSTLAGATFSFLKFTLIDEYKKWPEKEAISTFLTITNYGRDLFN